MKIEEMGIDRFYTECGLKDIANNREYWKDFDNRYMAGLKEYFEKQQTESPLTHKEQEESTEPKCRLLSRDELERLDRIARIEGMKVTEEMVLLVIQKRHGQLRDYVNSDWNELHLLSGAEKYINRIKPIVDEIHSLLTEFEKERQAEGKECE